MATLFAARMTDTVVERIDGKIKPLGDLSRRYLHFTARGATAKYWGTGLKWMEARSLQLMQTASRPVRTSWARATLLSAYPLEAGSAVSRRPRNHETAHFLAERCAN
jgi:hypothetical protein